MPWANINRTFGAGCAFKKPVEIAITSRFDYDYNYELSLGPKAQAMAAEGNALGTYPALPQPILYGIREPP